MAPPADPERRRVWALVLVGGLCVLFAVFTIGQALYLDANGVRVRAEVVDASHGGRGDFVRVRLDSGRETTLWAWSGEPTVGTMMNVVLVAEGTAPRTSPLSNVPLYRQLAGPARQADRRGQVPSGPAVAE